MPSERLGPRQNETAYWIPAFWVPALSVTHYVVFVLLGRRWTGGDVTRRASGYPSGRAAR